MRKAHDREHLRVAIDVRPLATSRAGVATYCRDLVRGLGAEDDGAQFLLYAKSLKPPDVPLGPAFHWYSMPAPLWLPVAVPRALRAGRIDVFHGTNHMAPPIAPVPTVVTVHDLSVLTMPWNHTWRNLLLTGPQMLLSLHRAARLIAISNFTARDLARLPGIDSARIRVIPRTHDPSLAPALPQAIEGIVHRLHFPRPFFLFLGGLGPNKNVITALRAVKSLWATGDRRARLVIAGAETPHTQDARRMVRRLGLDNAVHFAGYVAQPDLPALYGASTALVYPSLFEGFGLPPLEAMACGTPVVCSNAASLPEVVGDAALLVDPRSAADLAAALRSLLDSKDLRARLRERGLARAALFSAEKMACQTVEIYREAAAGRAPR